MTRIGRVAGLVIALTLTAAGIVLTQPVSALERVRDGGFDAASCNASDCTSPAWAESGVTLNMGNPVSGDLIGPICSGITGDCAQSASGYHSTFQWARLGARENSGINFNEVTSAVEQTVEIPAAPATFAFWLRIIDAGPQPPTLGSGTFNVSVGGTTVFTATDTTPGYSVYTPVRVDVSQFAGTARLIRFSGTGDSDAVQFSSSFDIDDVSLDAPEVGVPGKSVRCGGKRVTIVGSDRANTIKGTKGRDVIQAHAGNNVVKGRGGNDLLCGGGGKDRLLGGAGKDRLLGGAGKDKLLGGAKKDTCDGGAGKDRDSGCENVVT